MKKTFALQTEPHIADVGGTELQFRPEVLGDEFLDFYSPIQEARQQLAASGEDMTNVPVEQIRELNATIRNFLGQLMLPESRETFVGMRLPDRVLVELLEWSLELYGGGSQRPPTSSNGSATASRPPGTRGKGASRSRG